MRNIKFRAKCSSESRYAGEWVTGGVVFCEKTNDVLIISAITDMVIGKYHVISETVGQFTGLIDKNGKEVFEGDILTDGRLMYTVEYSYYSYGFVCHRHDSCKNFHIDKSDAEQLEIVGNIHDNPELK